MELETILARITENASVHDPYGASHTPIYQTATFDLKKQSGSKIYDYSRSDNPTRNSLEDIFTLVEEGSGAICTGTGIGAVALLFETVLQTGDTVLAEIDCYGGTYRLLHILRDKYKINVHYTDLTDYKNVDAYLKKNVVKLVICESPTNPGLKIIDVKRLAALCYDAGTLLAVDNSLATFASQKPLTLGADFSLFSATKYISGHGATVAGVIVSKDKAWAEKVSYFSNAGGRSQSPFDSFLISLGLPTLTYRMKAQEANALLIAKYLSTRSEVQHVAFPFLESHPHYTLAKKQMKICPALITLEMKDMETAEKFIKNSKLFGEKASFGSPDSRVEQPSKISHASYSNEDLKAIGITKQTLRLSIGLENPDDLINDIDAALK